MPVQSDNPVLQLYRGDSFVKTFQFYMRDPDTSVLTPLDLTLYGDTWIGQLRKTEDATDATTFLIDDSDADTGVISVSLTAAQTAGLPAEGVWDLQVTDTAQSPAFVRTMLRGTFERQKDVSRS